MMDLNNELNNNKILKISYELTILNMILF